MKTIFATITLCIFLSACGGGSDSPPLTEPANNMAKHGPALRPCETTGPDAPPCPTVASGQAVIH